MHASRVEYYLLCAGELHARTPRRQREQELFAAKAHSLHKLQEIPFITCDFCAGCNKFSLLSAYLLLRRERGEEYQPECCAVSVCCPYVHRVPRRQDYMYALPADHTGTQRASV
jgi:hypothetical protein